DRLPTWSKWPSGRSETGPCQGRAHLSKGLVHLAERPVARTSLPVVYCKVTDHRSLECQGAVALIANAAEARLQAKTLISVIDDDEDVRISIACLMESLGFTTEAFPSAVDFLASDAIHRTHCLIADVHMPHMTGLELYRHLRQSGYSIPTILIT